MPNVPVAPIEAGRSEETQLDRKLQMVAVDSIAEVAAAVFANPQNYLRQAIEIVGDVMTLDEYASN
jgi:uncharacterized protein YbjT (DUF2867 family)